MAYVITKCNAWKNQIKKKTKLQKKDAEIRSHRPRENQLRPRKRLPDSNFKISFLFKNGATFWRRIQTKPRPPG